MSDEFDRIKAVPTRQDLRALFPITVRLIFARSFWFLCVTAVIAFVPLLFNGYDRSVADTTVPSGSTGVFDVQRVILLFFDYALMLSLVVTCLKLIYEWVYRALFNYTIELEHLTITKGIFFRSRVSLPLARVHDVSLSRDPIEMLFFIYSLDVLTASPVMNSGRIEGLSTKSAVDLQTFLLALVETTLPEVRQGAAAVAQTREIPPPIVDDIIHGNKASGSSGERA